MANTFKFGNGNWAVKKDSVLAYNDENNNFKPLPFDFTRDSTATYVDSDGLIKTASNNEARIDYLDNADGHLLLEPSRTNLSTDSERMDLWSSLRTTETINSGISPDGENNAVKISMTSDTGEHSVYDGLSVETSTAYTNSIFIKRGTGSADWQYFQFRFRNGGFGTGGGVVVDIHNGQITYNTGLTDYGIENYGDGWYRVFITQTSTNASSSAGPVLAFNEISNGYDVSIVGDTNADVLVWGSQFESGSYPTSLIKTNGSSVTRAADRNSNSNLSNILTSSGVIYTEIELGKSTSNSSGSQIRFNLSNKSSTDWMFFGIESGDNLRAYVRAGSVTTTDTTIDQVFPSAGLYKIAMRYDTNNTKVFVNGVEKISDTTSTPPSNLSFLGISNSTNGGDSDITESVNIKDLKLYNTALTDAELITLTT